MNTEQPSRPGDFPGAPLLNQIDTPIEFIGASLVLFVLAFGCVVARGKVK